MVVLAVTVSAPVVGLMTAPAAAAFGVFAAPCTKQNALLHACAKQQIILLLRLRVAKKCLSFPYM